MRGVTKISANESSSDGVEPTSGVTVWAACQIEIAKDLRQGFSVAEKCYRDLQLQVQSTLYKC